jgi:hypothetical protein
MLNVTMLSVVTLSVVTLNVITLSGVIANVVVPFFAAKKQIKHFLPLNPLSLVSG